MTNLEKFLDACERNHRKIYEADPSVYGYPKERLDWAITNMRKAWTEGHANKDGPACKAACKELGIKHTYTAIRAFIRGEA